jgi:hypothetical protein
MAEFKLGRLKFVWRGDWATGATYVKDDIVKYGGKSYVCVQGHTAAADFYTNLTSALWQLMTDGFAWLGDWQANGTHYALGDVVSVNGRAYICITPHNSSSLFATDYAKWEIYADGFAWRGPFNISSTRYELNDIVSFGGCTYVCTTAHTTAGSFVTGNWQIFAEGFQYENSWSSSTAYQKGDVVGYGGYTYEALVNNSNVVPTADAGTWTPFLLGVNIKSVWTNSAGYKIGDVVQYGGYQYIALVDTLTTETPEDGYKWKIYSKGLSFLGTWSNASVRYKLGEVVKSGTSSYVCVQHHTSENAKSPSADTAHQYWAILADGAASAVITTRGDTLYYDSLGSQRLPIGTANQLYVVNSAGNEPQWSSTADITVNKINISSTSNPIYNSGNNVIVPLGNLTVSTGNFTVTAGSQTVTSGSINVNGTGSNGRINTQGSITIDSDANGVGSLFVGPGAELNTYGNAGASGFTDAMAVLRRSTTSFAQLALQNSNSGTAASTDVIVYSNNGNNDSGWIDMGITSSTFSDAEYGITGPNDGYIFMSAPGGTSGHGNLYISTNNTGTQNDIVFSTNGFGHISSEKMRLIGAAHDGLLPGLVVDVSVETTTTAALGVNITTTLNGTINASVTSLVLTSAASFPTSGTVLIGTEEITYSGKTSNTLTGCTRGTHLTTAVSHTTGGLVTLIRTTIAVADTTLFADTGIVQIDGEQISYESKTSTSLIGCIRGVSGTTVQTHGNGSAVVSVAFSDSTTSGALRVNGGIGLTGALNAEGNIVAHGGAFYQGESQSGITAYDLTQDDSLYAGYVGLSDASGVFTGDADAFVQFALKNHNSGISASTDLICYTSGGDNDSGWIDMGITSSNFADPKFTVTGPDTGYIFMAAPSEGIDTTSVGSTSAVATTINVVDTSAFPSSGTCKVAGGGQFSYTGKTATSFTGCTRGVNNSTAVAFNAGTRIYKLSTATYTGDLLIGTGQGGNQNDIVLFSGGFDAGNERVRIIGTSRAGHAMGVEVLAATAASSTTTGALRVNGGMGLIGNLYVGGNTYVTGNTTTTGDSATTGNITVTGNSTVNGNSTTTGNATVNGNMTIVGTITVGGAGSSLSTTTLTVTDPMIVLGKGNIGDTVELGVIGQTSTANTTVTGGVTLSASNTTVTVASTTGFTATGTIRIEDEEITYTGITGTTFTGCTRGANSTTGATHVQTTVVYQAAYHGLLRDHLTGDYRFFTGLAGNKPTTTTTFSGATYAGVRLGTLRSFSATDATSSTAAAVIFDGGLAVAKKGNFGDAITSGGLLTSVGVTSTGTVAINASTGITTNQSSFPIANTTATTIDFGGAATTLNLANTATGAQTVNLGTASTGASTYNLGTGATATSNTKTLNIGTGGAAGSTTNINIGSSIGGTLTVNSGTVVGTSATQNLFNTTATTLNIGGAATTVSIGASTGTTTVNNQMNFNGTLSLGPVIETSSTLTGATGTVAHSFTTSNVWYHTSIAANFTANITNVPTTINKISTITLVLVQGATPYIPSALQIDGVAQTIKWAGNTTPTPVASRTELVVFTLIRTGAGAWVVLGQHSSYA